MRTCYLATRPEAAAREALQMHLTNLPAGELRVRRIAHVHTPTLHRASPCENANLEKYSHHARPMLEFTIKIM